MLQLPDTRTYRVARKKINPATADEIIIACRRVCCMCYCLQQDATTKNGQLAHLDGDNTHNDPDNLAYLCLAHHDDYDTERRQTRNYTEGELKAYRQLLVTAIAEAKAPQPISQEGASLRISLKAVLLEMGFSNPKGLEASLLHICLGVSNAGRLPTGFEGVRLYCGECQLGDEQDSLARVSKTTGGAKSETTPTFFRRDAEWLTCSGHQMVAPGQIRWMVASFLIVKSSSDQQLPELSQLYARAVDVVSPAKKLLLEIRPVIGAPIAVEINEIESYHRA